MVLCVVSHSDGCYPKLLGSLDQTPVYVFVIFFNFYNSKMYFVPFQKHVQQRKGLVKRKGRTSE